MKILVFSVLCIILWSGMLVDHADCARSNSVGGINYSNSAYSRNRVNPSTSLADRSRINYSTYLKERNRINSLHEKNRINYSHSLYETNRLTYTNALNERKRRRNPSSNRFSESNSVQRVNSVAPSSGAHSNYPGDLSHESSKQVWL